MRHHTASGAKGGGFPLSLHLLLLVVVLLAAAVANAFVAPASCSMYVVVWYQRIGRQPSMPPSCCMRPFGVRMLPPERGLFGEGERQPANRVWV